MSLPEAIGVLLELANSARALRRVIRGRTR